MSGTILIVDDDGDMAALLCERLRHRGFNCDVVTSGAACLAHLRSVTIDVLIVDANMPEMSGMELCERVAADYPDVHTIVVTGAASLDVAIASIRAGAYDFITKPVNMGALTIAIARALENSRLKQELRALRSEARGALRHGIVGASSAIRTTLEMIDRVAGSDATVLITGESGTGKELVARALHDASNRRDRPFIAINCSAMPAPLLESELFGHVRGAFTDAKQARPGLFVQAGAGTIFLDEIGEMPMEMQVKILRVLQERRVRPVGGDDEISVKARVITATNRDLEHEIAEKRFREDLYYRINVVPIAIPPLRSRESDVLVLAHHFLQRCARRMNKAVEGISPAAATLLLRYDWPGNVRELENCMERAVALCRLTELTVDDLPSTLLPSVSATAVAIDTPSELVTIDEMTRRYVRKALAIANGNKTKAARYLGIDRRSLYRRLEEARETSSDPAPVESVVPLAPANGSIVVAHAR